MGEKRLFIKGSKTVPTIELDIDKNIFKIEGRSLASNTAAIYEPLSDWMTENLSNHTFTLEFELEYFNTSSYKYILFLLDKVRQLNDDNKVTWCYEEDDEEMMDIGKRMEMLSKVTFNFVEVKN